MAEPVVFTRSQPLRLLSLFSGIGAFEKALTRLNVPFEIINYCEIDKYASQAYSLIHNIPEELNLGDIQKINPYSLPDFDLLTWGFPCKNISIAGLQEGMKYVCKNCAYEFSLDAIEKDKCPNCKSTNIHSANESGLYIEGLKILKAKKPMYSVIENVKALTFKRNKELFNKILKDLEQAGYRNYYKVLNAKHYGIPQNRERIFIISIRKDINQDFQFPEPFDNGVRLKDLLETDVDEKYYLKGNFLKWWTKNKNYQLKKKYSSLDAEIAICLTARQYDSWNGNFIQKLDRRTEQIYKNLVLEDFLKKNIDIAMLTERRTEEAKRIRREYQKKYGRDYSPRRKKELVPRSDGISNCITATQSREHLLLERKESSDLRVRQLTPIECFRLMGFDDSDCQILIENQIPDRQLYRMAGNSIVVNVLEAIFKELIKYENVI